jgi:hypothetical protein
MSHIPKHQPVPERPRRPQWLPSPASRTGALFYPLVIWVVVDFLPRHVHILIHFT